MGSGGGHAADGAAAGGGASPGNAPNGVAARAAIDWGPIRLAYESGEGSVTGICAQFGVSRNALMWHARRDGWIRRNRSGLVDRPQIIVRMFRLLESQIIRLEDNMTETGEREAALLGRLASTLQKLIDIDNAAQADKRRPQATKDMKELRDRLAQRIAQIKG